MHQLVGVVLLLLQVAPVEELPPAVGERLRHPAESVGPFASIQDLGEWLIDKQPMTGGTIANLEDDPDEMHPTFFVLERDSTVWIQTPDGDMISLDANVAYQLGNVVDEELQFRETPPPSLGYGVEGGSLFLYGQYEIRIWAAFLLAVGLPILVGGILLWLWRRLRLATERGEQLADSRRRLADSREHERIQIARDLHDGPMQDLQVIRMQLGVLQRAAERGEADPEAAHVAIAEAQEEILRVGRELRGISEGLRPPVLGPFGLAAAVRAFADRFRTAHPGIDLQLDLRDDGLGLDERTRLVFYRIVQEALNNAAVHGAPSTIRVGFEQRERVRLTIEDDGAGFDVPDDLHQLEAEGHLGLAGMSERATSIGGTLTVESQRGDGTRILVQAPARNPATSDLQLA